MSESHYYLYNCCYFQVQFTAVWTHGSKGCHWLHVTNAPKAHILMINIQWHISTTSNAFQRHHVETAWIVFVLVCLWAQYTVLHCSSDTRMHTDVNFCVSHYPIQIYPLESERADHHEFPNTAAAIDGRNIWIEMVLFWSFGLEIDRMKSGSCEHMCEFMSLCSLCVCMNSPQHKLTAYDGSRIVAGEYLTHTLHLRKAVITVKSEALCQETLLHSETHNYRLDPDEKN